MYQFRISSAEKRVLDVKNSTSSSEMSIAVVFMSEQPIVMLIVVVVVVVLVVVLLVVLVLVEDVAVGGPLSDLLANSRWPTDSACN